MPMSEILIKEDPVSIYCSISFAIFSSNVKQLLTDSVKVRIKAQTLIAMMESPEKMESEKHKYHQIRAQMGRPGIVDMNGGDTPSDFRKVSHRMTFDIQPRTGGSASASSLSSNGTGAPAGGKGNLASPRSSFDNNRKQVTPRAPSFSLEGRYSLSLPLQSIQE